MSGLLGKLNVLLFADTAQFTSAMDKAAYTTNKTMNGMLRSVRGVAPQLAAALAAVGSVAGLKKVIDDADELKKVSQKIGITVESLSVLRHQASLADVDFQSLTTSVGRFSRVINDASQGAKGPSEAFAALNIEVRDSNGLLKTSEDLLLEVADRFSKMEDGVRKTALAQELFGRSGMDMIPLLNQGREGFKATREEAERLGIVISGQTAQAAEDFNDNMTRLVATVYGMGVQIGNELLPVLNTFTGQIVDATGKTSAFHEIAKWLGETFKNLAVGMRVTSGTVEALAKSFSAAKAIWWEASKFNFAGAIQIQKQALSDLDEVYKKTVTDAYALTKAQEDLAKATQESANETRLAFEVHEQAVRVKEDNKAIQQTAKETSNVMREMGATFTSSFEEAIISGQNFRDMLEGLLQDIERILLRRLILEPFFNALGSGIGSFFGGGASSGGAHQAAFASGGVINGPMSFPMVGGRGLAGEAGPEAIIPLKRTSGGDLGVKADVGGGVQVNVYAPPGSSVKQERKSDGGMESINIYIDEAVAGNISRPGSKTSRALKGQFGLGQELTRR